ncbi:MAG TPA: tRNA guanosine(34) transglycosylase Tgt [Candidatus Dormibacteraeota bacterium]
MPCGQLQTAHSALHMPAFLPDATRGVVRNVDSQDLLAVGVPGLMVNTLHLSRTPGVSIVAKLGGVHSFMGWQGPVAADSGGFQVMSLVAAAKNLARVSRQGFTYRFQPTQEFKQWTPERCLDAQLRLGADILFTLDYCTHPDAPPALQTESVELTIDWARRTKRLYEERTAERGSRPLLFAVVQGGSDSALRRRCAEALLEIGFDGYGFGGWPISDDGRLVEMVREVAELLPPAVPKHALGIGSPDNVRDAWRAGYSLFDCSLPTRNARRGKLYVRDDGAARGYAVMAAGDERWLRDQRPVEEGCDCPCCRTVSRAYLAHLFRIEDALAPRLATLHNLRFYRRMLDALRDGE